MSVWVHAYEEIMYLKNYLVEKRDSTSDARERAHAQEELDKLNRLVDFFHDQIPWDLFWHGRGVEPQKDE
jgi:hypothetical protein